MVGRVFTMVCEVDDSKRSLKAVSTISGHSLELKQVNWEEEKSKYNIG